MDQAYIEQVIAKQKQHAEQHAVQEAPYNAWQQGNLAYAHVVTQLHAALPVVEQLQRTIYPLPDVLDGFPHGYFANVRKHLALITESLSVMHNMIHAVSTADSEGAPCSAPSDVAYTNTIGSAFRR